MKQYAVPFTSFKGILILKYMTNERIMNYAVNYALWCEGGEPWSLAMGILSAKDEVLDAEMLNYTITLINKVP